MRLLLIDHGCCDHDSTRVHRCRIDLERLGIAAAVCGPSSVPRLEEQHAGMFGVHLHAIAAASHRLLAAVRDGSADALLAAIPGISPRLLGSVRETARQLIAEAVDATDPDAIFVMHGGILTDLAVETGAPVVAHVAAGDLTAAAGKPAIRELLTRSLGSCEVIVAADANASEALRDGWIDTDAAAPVDVWPIDSGCAERIADACRTAQARRRG